MPPLGEIRSSRHGIRAVAVLILVLQALTPSPPAVAGPSSSGAPDAATEEFLRSGLELLFRNQYDAAATFFLDEARRRPAEATPRVALILLYSIRMYELDNFVWERDLWKQSEIALNLARKSAGERALAWDHAMEASIYGMQGLLQARKEHWLSAARLGLKAKAALERSLKADPQFWDAYLGLGVYHYYGSVLTKGYWFLPGFGDQRKKGLSEIHKARERGRNFAALADYALLYILYEEKQYRAALALAETLAARNPADALSRSWVGWMDLRLGRYGAAAASFSRVRDGGAGRYHCLYHLGTSRLFEGRDLYAAVEALQHFLATEPPNFWRARAYNRLGMAHLRLGNREAAISAYKASSFIDPHFRLPKERLQALEREQTATPKIVSPAGRVPSRLAQRNDG